MAKSTYLLHGMCLLLCMLLIKGAIYAQETYTKVWDRPDDVIKGHVAFEYYGIDVGFGNITGAMLFVVGINGSYPLTSTISVEGNVRMPLLRFEKEGPGFIIDGGAVMKLSSVSTPKNVKVILSLREEAILGTNYRRRTTKYVTVNADVKRTLILRGGLYTKNTTFKHKAGSFSYETTSIFHKGLYLGIGRQRQYFVQLERDNKGKKDVFGAGTIVLPYFDIMILPTTVTLSQETYGMGRGASLELTGLFGARAGLRWYRNPFTRDLNNNNRLSFFANSIVNLEAGVRPLEGFYFSGGVSYIVRKF